MFPGLIRWGIVFHCFINRFLRLITAFCAHNNNRGATVLALFLAAIAIFGTPNRVHGDHSIENIQLAQWMEDQHAGSIWNTYIWGRHMCLFGVYPFIH
jgi:hypothetical protein